MYEYLLCCIFQTKPLSHDGSLNLINNFDALHLIYFKNAQKGMHTEIHRVVISTGYLSSLVQEFGFEESKCGSLTCRKKREDIMIPLVALQSSSSAWSKFCTDENFLIYNNSSNQYLVCPVFCIAIHDDNLDIWCVL